MNPDEHHVALPKLYGAPAYARPPRVFDSLDRPLDLDDLPLEAFRTDEDTLILGSAAGTATSAGGEARVVMTSAARASDASADADADAGAPALRPRQFSVRGLARLLQGRDEGR